MQIGHLTGLRSTRMDDNRITYFAETDARNRRVKFGIKANDRARHVYVIGKTGMGKSTLLENMAVQDIQNGSGMCFIDPHGKTADLLLEYVPKERMRDVIYIAPFDVEYPISFNVLESVDRDKRHLVSSGLMSTFKKIWEDAWSARMEYILTNTLLALLEYPGATLLGVNRMLSDKEYRKDVVSHIQDPSVKAFWVKEFANYTERQAAEAVPAIQNKVGQFTANPLIRNMIGQAESSFNFREAMDQRKIIIINLSKGRIGDENMKLLGGLLVTKIYLAAMSRADVPDRVMKMLPNFYLFVDEFQNFANASFADILSEARKYKLNLTIAHQYIEQMDEIVRPAVFGNVGTMMTFRVGAKDAEMLEMEFAPQFTVEDLVNLGQYQMYLKLMIDGLTSPPFSATNLPPFPHPDISYVKEIIEASREQFARPRAEVENMIVQFHNPTPPPKVVKSASPIGTAAPSSPAPTSPTPAPSPRPQPAPSVQAPRPTPPKPVQVREASPAPRPLQEKKEISSPPPATSVASSAPAPKPIPKPAPEPKPIPTTPAPKPVQSSNAPSAPQSKPQSTSSAPKSTLADSNESKPIQAQAPVSKPIQKPAAPVFEPVRVTEKPVQLSSLAQKNPAKADPKAPTAENVNSLKNALAAAMAKGKPEVKAVPKKETPPSFSGAASSPAPKTPPVASPAPQAPAPSSAPQVEAKPTSSTANQNAPAEVPEDVLKNILKDE